LQSGSAVSSSPRLVQRLRCCQVHGYRAYAQWALYQPFCWAGYWQATQPTSYHRRSTVQSAVNRRKQFIGEEQAYAVQGTNSMKTVWGLSNSFETTQNLFTVTSYPQQLHCLAQVLSHL